MKKIGQVGYLFGKINPVLFLKVNQGPDSRNELYFYDSAESKVVCLVFIASLRLV